MDTFFDSSWYFYRYCDPRNDRAPFDPEIVASWFPIDLYIGGINQAHLHLIYCRFFTRVMRDLGLVTLDEPVVRLMCQGMVLKEGAAMSKSRGNVVDPDELIKTYGADTTRLFTLFAAPPEKDLEWDDQGVEGCYRFLERVWRLFAPRAAELTRAALPGPRDGADDPRRALLRRRVHQTMERVTDDLDRRLHLNTPVSSLMQLLNDVRATDGPATSLISRRRGPRSRSCSSRWRRTSRRSCGRAWAGTDQSWSSRGRLPMGRGSSRRRSRWSCR
jgi:leucyl-tRNA synthetase